MRWLKGNTFCYDVFCSSYWKKMKKEFWLLTLEAGWFNNMPNREHTGNKRWSCGQLCLASAENDRFIVSQTAHSATRCASSCFSCQNGWIWTWCCHLIMVRDVGTVRFRLWDWVIGNSLLILNRADFNLLTQTSCWQQRKQAFIAPEHSYCMPCCQISSARTSASCFERYVTIISSI